uniref:Uncharacterized protein n=1 Tax=Anguilla anguilla TaxID=7936 RepID=A0A0E9RAS4_ANGAN
MPLDIFTGTILSAFPHQVNSIAVFVLFV